MDKEILIPTTSSNNVEMSSTQDVTNDESVNMVSVPDKNYERKKQKKNEIKKKTVNAQTEKPENKTRQEKAKDDSNARTDCGYTELNSVRGKCLKRKATTEDSENDTEQKKEDNIFEENENTKRFKKEQDDTKFPNVKTVEREKSESTADQKPEDDTNIVDGNTGRNDKEDSGNVEKVIAKNNKKSSKVKKASGKVYVTNEDSGIVKVIKLKIKVKTLKKVKKVKETAKNNEKEKPAEKEALPNFYM